MRKRPISIPSSKSTPGIARASSTPLPTRFFELEVSIQLAKISTPGAQVADIFYVTDMSGNKLLLPELHESIRERLIACLSSAC